MSSAAVPPVSRARRLTAVGLAGAAAVTGGVAWALSSATSPADAVPRTVESAVSGVTGGETRHDPSRGHQDTGDDTDEGTTSDTAPDGGAVGQDGPADLAPPSDAQADRPADGSGFQDVDPPAGAPGGMAGGTSSHGS